MKKQTKKYYEICSIKILDGLVEKDDIGFLWDEEKEKSIPKKDNNILKKIKSIIAIHINNEFLKTDYKKVVSDDGKSLELVLVLFVDGIEPLQKELDIGSYTIEQLVEKIKKSIRRLTKLLEMDLSETELKRLTVKEKLASELLSLVKSETTRNGKPFSIPFLINGRSFKVEHNSISTDDKENHSIITGTGIINFVKSDELIAQVIGEFEKKRSLVFGYDRSMKNSLLKYQMDDAEVFIHLAENLNRNNRNSPEFIMESIESVDPFS